MQIITINVSRKKMKRDLQKYANNCCTFKDVFDYMSIQRHSPLVWDEIEAWEVNNGLRIDNMLYKDLQGEEGLHATFGMVSVYIDKRG